MSLLVCGKTRQFAALERTIGKNGQWCTVATSTTHKTLQNDPKLKKQKYTFGKSIWNYVWHEEIKMDENCKKKAAQSSFSSLLHIKHIRRKDRDRKTPVFQT